MNALDIAAQLNKEMPGIGFLSRAKRIQAFAFMTARADELSKDDLALSMQAIAMLTHMNKDFHRAIVMTAISINRMSLGSLCETGWIMANELAIREGLLPNLFYRT